MKCGLGGVSWCDDEVCRRKRMTLLPPHHTYTVTQLAHHGMIYVPAGYTAGGVMYGVQHAKGGSPWGAGTLAGADGSRQPSEVELEAVKAQVRWLLLRFRPATYHSKVQWCVC